MLPRPVAMFASRNAFLTRTSLASSFRPFSTTKTLAARKAAQGKDDINRESTEYSLSGSDDATAGSNAAFDPKTTAPESQKEQAQGESGSKAEGYNPLDTSPGNHEVSKKSTQESNHTSRTPGDPQVSGERSSGGGSTGTPKNV